MFDPLVSWPDTMGNGRVVDPPLPVVVDLGSLFPPRSGAAQHSTAEDHEGWAVVDRVRHRRPAGVGAQLERGVDRVRAVRGGAGEQARAGADVAVGAGGVDPADVERKR